MERYCIDCNKQLNNFHAKRCKSCARKYQYKIHPETNPWYIDNRTNNKRHCIDCGKELSRSANSNDYKRCKSCSRKGELHWNWLDGNKYGYTIEFSEELKSKIRKRDNYTCQVCGMTEEEHITVYGYVLLIHHIDYNKKNCEEGNLISVCSSCHMRTNYNRKYWIVELRRKLCKKN